MTSEKMPSSAEIAFLGSSRIAYKYHQNVVNELCEAIRLTAEYAQLPQEGGWSWYDALKKYRPDMLGPDMQYWTPESDFPRYNVHPMNQLRVKCPNDPLSCKDHCHWRVIDHKEGETVSYFYSKELANEFASFLNACNEEAKEVEISDQDGEE